VSFRPGASAWIVVDLGFGDSGKGTTVDFLARDLEADLVVRFNGGAQAGHNVVTTDRRHHTFAQFGSGTFVPGVGTHLGPAFVLHPGGLLVEARYLAAAGVGDALERLTIDARAPVITPYQQAAGRLREIARGAAAHGTTGVGVGEVRLDQAAGWDDVVVAGDLQEPDRLRAKLRSQQERKWEELADEGDGPGADDERAVLLDRELVDVVLESWAGVDDRVIEPELADARLRSARRLVLEGAQGVLLDERWGFHPHTTWSDCTFAGAEALIGDRERVRLGVVRAYQTRHGAGPFPTHDPTWSLPERHNPSDGWAGAFRVGPLDGVLLRYASEVVRGVDGIVVTCLDRVSEVRPYGVCVGYHTAEGLIDRVPTGAPDDWAHRETLGRRLREVRPEVEPADPVEFVAERVGAPVVLTSHGPTAADKRWHEMGSPPRA
jgi:adenylosuccinate synthase